jgi:hypothetical protein
MELPKNPVSQPLSPNSNVKIEIYFNKKIILGDTEEMRH